MTSHALPKPQGAGTFKGALSYAAYPARQGMANTRGIKTAEGGRPRGLAGEALPVSTPVEPEVLGIPEREQEVLGERNGHKPQVALSVGSTAAAHGERSDAGRDDAVIRRVLDGDTEAFELLIRQHSKRVYGAVARHVPYDQREEVVQDTWVRAFQSLDGFQPGTRFGDWLTGIAVRASYDFWRQHYRRREVPESALGDSHREWIEAAGADQSAEDFQAHVRREEAQEILEYALAHVSPEDRLVVSLVHLEGLSAQEAAKQLGWSVVNVKVRAHRSRRRMRQALEKWLGKEIL